MRLSIIFLLTTLFACPLFGEALVKIFPSELRDDNVAYLYNDHPSVVSFYLFSSDKPIPLEDAQLTLTLPDSLRVADWHLWRSESNESVRSTPKIQDDPKGQRRWTLDLGKLKITRKFAPNHLTTYSHEHVYVWVAPESGRSVPDTCDIPWKLTNAQGESASGVIKAAFLPLPHGKPLPKHFEVWTWAPYDVKAYTDTNFSTFLDVAKACGATTLVTAYQSHQGQATDLLKFKRLIQPRGMKVYDTEILTNMFQSWRSDQLKAALKEAGYELQTQDYAVDYMGTRMKTRKEVIRQDISMWCPTRMAQEDSPILNLIAQQIGESNNQGNTGFFVDYEVNWMGACFCPLCRDAFAAYAKLNADDAARVKEMKGTEILHQFPAQWYAFRSTQTGLVFDALRKKVKKTHPDARIGLDNSLSSETWNTVGVGFGIAGQGAEDPRFFGDKVDFNMLDIRKGTLSDIYRGELYFDTLPGREITAANISMACGFYDLGWSYFCVVSRRGWAMEKDNAGLATDNRAERVRLSIASSAAQGAKGVFTFLANDSTDSITAHAVRDALAYVAEYEKEMSNGTRESADTLAITVHNPGLKDYENWLGKSPYKGYQIQPVEFYGPIWYQVRKLDSTWFAGVFNWDTARSRELTLKFPKLPDSSYRLEMYRDGKRYQLANGSQQTWTADQLAEGFSVTIPAAGMLGFRICPPESGRVAELLKVQRLPIPKGAKQVDLEEWKKKVDPKQIKPSTDILKWRIEKTLDDLKKGVPAI